MMIERKWLVGMQKLSAVVFYCFFVTKLTIRQKREFIQAVVIQQFTRSTVKYLKNRTFTNLIATQALNNYFWYN